MSRARARRLEVVLRVRRIAEDRAKIELGVAAGRLARARAARDAAVGRLDREQAWLGELQARTASGGELASATVCLAVADERVEAAGVAISQAIEVLAVARDRLAETTKARSVVDRLRDRALEAARLDEERHEIAELSELAGVRHAWQVISGEPA
jgi:flagellar export protein FliJ